MRAADGSAESGPLFAKRAPLFRVTKFAGEEAENQVINAIGQASFTEPNFSIEEELARPWARIWVARGADDNPAILGFLITWHVADELHILNIATAPEARRQGVGKALMDVGLAYAKEHEVSLLLLEVRSSNGAAQALYRRFGFEAFSVRRAYYTDNGEDAVEMRLALNTRP